MIDKAVVESASGSRGLVASLSASGASALRNPLAFVRSPMYLWIVGVYGACLHDELGRCQRTDLSGTFHTAAMFANTPSCTIA